MLRFLSVCDPLRKGFPSKGGESVENMIKGLALEELEAHGRAALLPDRVEMRRASKRITKRIRRGNVRCLATNVAGDDVFVDNKFVCQRINA